MDLPSICFQATRGVLSDNLRMFKEAVIATIGDDNIVGGMANWHSTLHHLASVAERIPSLVVTLDEFPFPCEEDKARPSQFNNPKPLETTILSTPLRRRRIK